MLTWRPHCGSCIMYGAMAREIGVPIAVLRILVAWGPIVAMPVGILSMPLGWPRWAVMWLLAFAIYAGAKWLTLVYAVLAMPAANGWRALCYLLAWPGLDAPTFLGVAVRPKSRPGPGEWTLAIAKTALGALLFWGVARLIPSERDVVQGWIGMIGLAFLLHFGMFHLLSCAWRQVGVRAEPLMNAPILASSVSEFWGKRWNTAFRDLTHRFLFRPLAARIGPRWSILAGFFFSGLVHDLVISVPANGGYGLPTVFFTIQAAALLFERSPLGRSLGLMRGWRGWLFTMTVLLGPAGWLFHPHFVRNVILPFLTFAGALA